MTPTYEYTKGNGIKKQYAPDKWVHKGVRVAQRITPDGIVIRTRICQFKNSGKYQYFLDKQGHLSKLDGTQARKLFKL